MILNYIIAVLDRDKAPAFTGLCAQLSLPVVLAAMGRGTATEEELDYYGLRRVPKTVIFCTADEEKTMRLKHLAMRKMYIDIPGNGVLMVIPIKSVSGRASMQYLAGQMDGGKEKPNMQFPYELVIAICNRGSVDEVMQAARSAGASGGTIIHASNAGADEGAFLGLHLAAEKDVLLIAAKSEIKASIMKAIIEQAGPETDAQAVAFSLPISEVAGFRRLDDLPIS